jgi:hypothetical protein
MGLDRKRKMAQSTDRTEIPLGSTATITDASGNQWGISTGGQVTVNGKADPTTQVVTELDYIGGKVWQENSGGGWWSKTIPTDTWLKGPDPLFNDTDIYVGPDAPKSNIIGIDGTSWSLTPDGFVTVNGVIDKTTQKVIRLEKLGNEIWQENVGDHWWEKVRPSDVWAPTGGVVSAPVGLPVPQVASPNDTVVIANLNNGSITSFIDNDSNTWTIDANGQINVNGIVDQTTHVVTKIAFVDGKVWQENAANLWWEKSTITDAWGPIGGTTTNPLPNLVILQPGQTYTMNGVTDDTIIAATGVEIFDNNNTGRTINVSGSHMGFLSNSTDTISLNGTGNTIISNAASSYNQIHGDGYTVYANGKTQTGMDLHEGTGELVNVSSGSNATISGSLGSIINLAVGSHVTLFRDLVPGTSSIGYQFMPCSANFNVFGTNQVALNAAVASIQYQMTGPGSGSPGTLTIAGTTITAPQSVIVASTFHAV